MKCLICSYENDIFKSHKTICKIPEEFRGEELIRYECPKCGVIFGPLDMLYMEKKDLEMIYRRHYNPQKEGRRRALGTIGLIGLTDVVKKGQSCLSWGSGPGSEASKRAEKMHNIELWNYDPFGDPEYRTIKNENELKKYNGIISHDVIEHLQNPVNEFLKMKSHLYSGSKMRHVTDCYRYTVVNTKFHLFFYVKNSSDILAEKTGFKKINKDTYILKS